MKRIIISAVLAVSMVIPSLAQTPTEPSKEQPKQEQAPEKGVAALKVQVPMLCGDADSIRAILKEWKMTDVMIGANPVTPDTAIIYHFSRDNSKMVITQWDMDMTAGCIAFVGNNTRLNRKGLKDIDPSY